MFCSITFFLGGMSCSVGPLEVLGTMKSDSSIFNSFRLNLNQSSEGPMK